MTPSSLIAEAALMRADDAQSATAITLLKKAMDNDKQTVAELLPDPGHRLDIRA